jgi:hypothetical protein
MFIYNTGVSIVHIAIIGSLLGFMKMLVTAAIVFVQIAAILIFLYCRLNAMKFYCAFDGVK